MNPNRPEFTSGQILGVCSTVALEFLLLIAIHAFFFRFVSKAIGISWDETAMEQSPPNMPLAQWNASGLQPERQRQMLVDTVFLMGMVPLMLLFTVLVCGCVLEIMFRETVYLYIVFSLIRNIDTLIGLEVCLVMLTVLWVSYNPAKRLFGFSRLFLTGGLLAFCVIEIDPLLMLVLICCRYDIDVDIFETQRMYFLCHMMAAVFLVYALLASAICYFLHTVRKRKIVL